MNPPSHAAFGSAVGSPAAMSRTRHLSWSVRRELWENRSIYIAPLVVAGAFLLVFLITTGRWWAHLAGADQAKQQEVLVMPYCVVAGLLLATAFIVGAIHCLDAITGERRDRSVLFWKSLPVSDRTTVLSKAAIPLVVLPVVTYGAVLAAWTVMLVLSTLRLLGNGPGLELLWTRLPILKLSLGLLYTVVVIALWHAPVYGWLLMVSAWARRVAILWAVLPLVPIGMLEAIFAPAHSGFITKHIFVGWALRAFHVEGAGSSSTTALPELTPGRFLSSPGLWIGLVFAVAFFAAAVRMRRSRDPN